MNHADNRNFLQTNLQPSPPPLSDPSSRLYSTGTLMTSTFLVPVNALMSIGNRALPLFALHSAYSTREDNIFFFKLIILITFKMILHVKKYRILLFIYELYCKGKSSRKESSKDTCEQNVYNLQIIFYT